MIPLSVTPDISVAPWSDLRASSNEFGLGTITRIGRLPGGTTSGLSTVTIVITLDDGRQVMGQTTMRLLSNAVAALCRADCASNN